MRSTYTIDLAIDFIKEAHKGQTRKGGGEYWKHPYRVAQRVDMDRIHIDSINDSTTVAALLHDVLEDTDVTYATLHRTFGEEVAGIVDLLSKTEEEEFRTKRYMARFRHVSERVKLIKFFDIMDNLYTLHEADDEEFIRFYIIRAREWTLYLNWNQAGVILETIHDIGEKLNLH